MNWKSKLVAGPAVNLVVMVMMFAASVTPVRADGESDGTFPAWEERWIHQLINRARSDPQYEMDACGDNCPDAGCYSQTAPLPWKTELNRAGRFHSTTMTLQGFFSHTSACTFSARRSGVRS